MFHQLLSSHFFTALTRRRFLVGECRRNYMLSRWSLVRFQLSRKRSSSVAEQRNCFFKLCRRPNFMNIEDIAIALDLQNRAYALLLWTARKAPGLLETDSLAASDSCERWLARHWNVFDTEFRQSFGEL